MRGGGDHARSIVNTRRMHVGRRPKLKSDSFGKSTNANRELDALAM